MDRTLIWSEESLDDIDSIAEYISRDSVHYAQQVVSRIFDLEDSILDDPLIGRIVPEFNNPALRERFLYSYRVIYETQESQIHVLAVIHGSRLLKSTNHFDDESL